MGMVQPRVLVRHNADAVRRLPGAKTFGTVARRTTAAGTVSPWGQQPGPRVPVTCHREVHRNASRAPAPGTGIA